uniref:Uncharacterized protein n=1 Tax=Xiphophorus couchianus TaxID=32473 RepID=A0A3B5KKY9_9TELE
PEFPRKDYGNYFKLPLTQICSLSFFERCLYGPGVLGAELEDVKKLLKGRSSSVSPTRSSASVTLPVPKKASVETKTVSVGTQSGQYDTLDSAFPTFSWSTSTLPSSTTVVAGNPTSYTYQLGQVSANNMSGGSPPLSPIPQQSLSVYGFQNNLAPASVGVLTTSGGYGVQKNAANGSAVISSGISTATRSQIDDVYKRDYRYMASDKENVPARREGEMLILAKDSGKQFTTTSSSLSGDSIKKEKLISSYVDTGTLKAETGNSYCKHNLYLSFQKY